MDARRDGVTAAALGALSAALYAALPLAGDRQWDGLMTASVLARPDAVSAREVLFFAHPLVIPLTAPFAWLARDALAAPALREACFGGVVVALAYLAARAASGGRAAGLFAAAVLALARERWRLASGGEEKEVALAFGAAFLMGYCDHRGLVAMALPAWWRRARGVAREVALGALLALACAVHLVNGLLALVVVADVALARGGRRAAAGVAARTLGVAACVAAPFFVGVAVLAGGARGARDVAAYYLEYHLSGEFTSVPASVPGRLMAAYHGGRTWLAGPAPPPGVAEWVLAAAAATAVCARAARVAPGLVARLLAWIALLAAHFVVYEPWDPEAWGPAGFAWAVVGAVGLLAPGGRAARARGVVAAVALAALAARDARDYAAARRAAGALAEALGAASASSAPIADVARWLDARAERDAVIVVSHRLVASYFHACTRRRDVVVRDYLDVPRARLRAEARLTTLSLRFYAPAMSSADLRAAAAAGRPVYLVTFDRRDRLDDVRALPWGGLRVGRWHPEREGLAPR